MIDRRFYKNSGPYKLSEIAAITGCELPNSYDDAIINEIKPLSEASAGDISFFANPKYLEEFKQTNASACIVPNDLSDNHKPLSDKVILLKAANPSFAYSKLISLFYSSAKEYRSVIMPTAYVSRLAKIGKNCYIGHNVVIEDNVVIGDDSIIEAGSFVDFGVKIGNRARIYSHVSLSYCEIGDDVVILPGARVGQDGFGFATEKGVHHKILHVGKVIIGNNVEIGANVTIDRGSVNDTIIEDLCRIDNLVQIAHNVHIGHGSIIVAQVGIAGSSKIGKYCALGGQVGIAGHLHIGDKAQIAAQGGVTKDIEAGVIMGGTPAVPIRDYHKQAIIMKKLIQNTGKP